MDNKDGESSSSQQLFLADGVYAPATPAKPSRSENMISKEWPQNPFDEALFEDSPANINFSRWKSNCGSTSQASEIHGGMYNNNTRFSADDANTWQSIPCLDLLAFADGSIKNGPPILHNFLADLNAPPLETVTTVTEPEVIIGSQEAEVSTIVESNQNTEKELSEQINLNETPQPKQKRRKHRPKVIKERKQKTPKKPVTPKAEGSSTGKRKYVRKKPVEKSTPPPVVETIDLTTDNEETTKSCKRKINFDEVEKGTEVVVEKTQVVETCPITPSKTEVPKDVNQNYKKAKCRLDFSQESHDKGVGSVLGPNESNCSTSGHGSKQQVLSKIDRSGILYWDNNVGNCPESLEAYLSTFTNYNSFTYLPTIYQNNIMENHQTSITSVQDSNCNFLIGQNGNKGPEMVKEKGRQVSNKKRTKAFTMVNDPALLGTHQQHMYMEAQVSKVVKKRGKKTHVVSSLNDDQQRFTNLIGCHPKTINALVQKFEQLDINGVKKDKDKVAVVPYMSGYSELNNNAIVVFQGHGSVVPYDGLFNPVRKRKPRPKVDLDDETSRVWRLLLEDINSQGVDGTDEDKAKWWEEERRVFRGRADSFIARMHLVQGDRRFSMWKGSVLDSVIGVFLTQNVSDHLSSSAFMSLVSRYPSKSKNTSEPLHEENNSNVSVQEPLDEEEIITLQDNEKQEVVYSNEVSKNSAYTVDLNETSETGVEDIISSQNSNTTSPSSVQSPIEQQKEQSIEQQKESSIEQQKESSIEQQKESSIEQQKDTCQAPVGSFMELLHMQGSTSEKTVLPKECGSEESGLSAESAAVQIVKNVISQKANGKNEEVVEKVVEVNSKDKGRKQLVKGKDENGVFVDKVREGKKQVKVDWDKLRMQAQVDEKKERLPYAIDSLDYEALMKADASEIADAIKERGMNNVLALRIKALLDRIVKDHGEPDLEWLRDVPPDKAKEYLLSFRGLGLKSVECVRLLTLHHLAFPVDTNVGRIAVRLGWVPLQPLPESLQLHLLELYPVLETIQQYLWPRLCKLDQKTLYELHYQMITFGKVFCTKSKPNCNACPMRGECRHFASAYASARLGLPAPEGCSIPALPENTSDQKLIEMPHQHHPPPPSPTQQQNMPHQHCCNEQPQQLSDIQNCNPVIEEPKSPSGPIIEVPATPEQEQIQQELLDIEDFGVEEEDSEEIPMIKLNMEAFTENLQTFMERHMELGEGDMSKALVALTSEAAAIPTPKLKNVSQLRTEHQVYELPDTHPLLEGLDRREPDDPCSYLLAIWTPGETANSIQPPEGQCSSQESGTLCNEQTCFFCNATREANSQTVRGTLLIPCRTAMRGSFPLNGTYFQVNEVFADHASSLSPIDVPRSWLWNLPRRTVYFGTSIPTIFKGLTTEEIQYCFWRGFVCVRGFDQKTRAPRPLKARLHFPASRIKRTTKTKTDHAN